MSNPADPTDGPDSATGKANAPQTATASAAAETAAAAAATAQSDGSVGPISQVQPADDPTSSQPEGGQSTADKPSLIDQLATLRGQMKFLVATCAVLLMVMLTMISQSLASVMRPLAIAAFCCYLIYPAVRWLVAKKVPKPVAYLISLAGIGLLCWGLALLFRMNVANFLDNLPSYEANLDRLEIAARAQAANWNIEMSDEPWTLEALWNAIPGETATAIVSGGASAAATFFTNVLVIIFFMIFILMEVQWFDDRMHHALGKERGDHIAKVMSQIHWNIEHYIWLKVIVSAATALIAGVTMAIFGLDFFAVLALMIFLFNFIPYFGSVIATVAPMAVGFLQFEHSMNAVWMGLILTVVQQFAGNYWEPRLQGRQLDLSPLLILFALGFWGWLWGLIGLILAVPLMVIQRIILEQFEVTKPLAIMLGDAEGRPFELPERLEKMAQNAAKRVVPELNTPGGPDDPAG